MEYFEVLRILREKKGLKQIDVANVIGTSQQYYSSYETGKADLPMRVTLTLAEFYEVSTDYLLGLTDCREGLSGLNKSIVGEYTTGRLVSNVLALSSHGRRAVLEYVELQRLGEEAKKQK